MGGQAGQGGGFVQGPDDPGQGAGMNNLLGMVLPFAALAAGIYRPQAGQSFMNFAQLAQQDASARREKEERKAMAEQLKRLGYTTDPNVSASVQVALANAQAAQTREARQAAEERRKVAEAERGRAFYAGGAGIEAQIGQEDPDVLQARLAGLSPQTQQEGEAFGRTRGRVEESAKRLAQARAAAAPFAEREAVDLGPGSFRGLRLGTEEEPLEGAVAEGLGTGQRLRVPPLEVQRLPPGAEALQRYIMETGAVPSAEDAAAQFGLALPQLPGGAAAGRTQAEEARKAAGERRAAVKPPFAPEVRTTTDSQGNVHVYRTVTTPEGQVSTQEQVFPGAGQVQAPSLNQAEILNSLAMVVKGQPQQALPMHRNLTPQDANEVFKAIRQADRTGDPGLAATLLWDKADKVREEITKIEQDIQSAKAAMTDQARMQAETRLTQKRDKLRILEGQLDLYIQAGGSQQGLRPVGSPPPAPPPLRSSGGISDAERAARLKAAGAVR